MNAGYSPIVVAPDNSTSVLQRVNILDNSYYNERWLQELIFNNERLLPLYEVEPDYIGAFPVCMELSTRSGRIDCLHVTSTGRLVITEVKLYRNPESRREVMGQILDYAKDLVSMDYMMLDESIKKSTNGRSLYDFACEIDPQISEANFVDAVQRNLKRGRFLLLIVGDGIREGAFDIKEFLNQNASMEFAFAMVEMRVFHMNDKHFLVQPEVLHKTNIIQRHVISIENHSSEHVVERIEEAPAQDPPSMQKAKDRSELNATFWRVFLDNIKLNDKTQPLPTTSTQSHLYFQLPPSTSVSWITVYKLDNREVGVFVRFAKSPQGEKLYQDIQLAKSFFQESLMGKAVWKDTERKTPKIVLPKMKINLKDRGNWKEAHEYYQTQLNILIDELRPLLKRMVFDDNFDTD
ncbi:DUF4268 domain-containing protein [Vibrio crassostreae]|uniref:DUF4268 domain-containing protein n=1 Tax=Vibrio crassostreae TaxID=246167 RepID=UPI001B30363A|nr:DUF4268 domain-containing protein [Vibrio crassostreae]